MATIGLPHNVQFYKSQGTRYDGFREALLTGRDVFVQYVMPWVRHPQSWVSVGCSTVRDVECVCARAHQGLRCARAAAVPPAPRAPAMRAVWAVCAPALRRAARPAAFSPTAA